MTHHHHHDHGGAPPGGYNPVSGLTISNTTLGFIFVIAILILLAIIFSWG